MTAIVLTIAGSDPSGGAGVQADLKTFSALGAYGAAAITGLTAQNTRGVQGVSMVDPGFVRLQIESVFADLAVDAVKIGMLGTPAITRAVAGVLRDAAPAWIVLDPVMVAKGGDRLLAEEAIAALEEELLPLAHLVTPNLPEAALLAGTRPVLTREAMREVAATLRAAGPRAVLVKGGHLESADSPDLLLDGDGETWFEGERVGTRNTHGTGCTLASAIATLLARGSTLPAAVKGAKAYLGRAIAAADDLAVGSGDGHGPVHHFHRWWPEPERPA